MIRRIVCKQELEDMYCGNRRGCIPKIKENENENTIIMMNGFSGNGLRVRVPKRGGSPPLTIRRRAEQAAQAAASSFQAYQT